MVGHLEQLKRAPAPRFSCDARGRNEGGPSGEVTSRAAYLGCARGLPRGATVEVGEDLEGGLDLISIAGRQQIEQ